MSWPAPDPRDRIPTTAEVGARAGRPSRRIALGLAAAALTGALAYGASAVAQSDPATTATAPATEAPAPADGRADCGPGVDGWGGAGGRHGRWGGRGGELTAIDATTLTVEGRRGSRTITTTDATVYQRLSGADAGALANGAQVAVMGRPSGDGTVDAKVVTILPAGQDLPDPPLTDRGRHRGPAAVGTVSDRSDTGFTLTRPDGSTVTVTIDAGTRYARVERISRSDLKVGDRIAVRPDPDTGNAARVTVLPDLGQPDAG